MTVLRLGFDTGTAGRKEVERKWRSFKRFGINAATLAEMARQSGADLSEIAFRHKIANSPLIDDGFGPDQLQVGPIIDQATREILEPAVWPALYWGMAPSIVF